MKSKMDFMQDLRGYAALLVVIGHFLDMYVKHNNPSIHFSGITSFVNSFELGRVGIIASFYLFFLIVF